jgi:transposase
MVFIMGIKTLAAADFSKMSKEEIIAYFENKTQKLENKTQKLENQNSALVAKNTKLEERNVFLENQVKTCIVVTSSSLININQALKLAGKKGYDFSGVLPEKDLSNVLKVLLDDFQSWFNNAKSWLGQTPFVANSEKLGLNLTSLNESAIKDLEAYARSSVNNEKKHLKLIELAHQAVIKEVESLKAAGKDIPENLLAIYNEAIIEVKAKSKVKHENKGKQAKSRFVKAKQKKVGGETPTKCPKCNGTNLKSIATVVSNLMTEKARNEERLQPLTLLTDLYICDDCGKAIFVHEDDTPHPVLPNHQIDSLTIIRACEFIFRGIPLNNFESEFVKSYEFGTDSVARELHNYVKYFITPLFNLIEDKVKESEVLLCDETVFRVLQSQGKGNRSNEFKDAIASGEQKTRSKNYILALTAGPAFPHKLSLYKYIESRSADSIGDYLCKFKNCRSLVTDAYAAYPKIVKEKIANCKLQTCIIHMRREFFKALSPKEYASQYAKLTDKEISEIIEKNIESNSLDAELILSVFNAISKLYVLESYVDYQNQDAKNQKKIMKLRERQAGIFNQISSIINILAKDKVKQNEKGEGYRCVNSNDKVAKACIYFLNSQNNLMRFLSSTEIPPDTNAVEGQIRPLTILRKNIYHKNADWGMHDLTAIYTVMQTLKINGFDAEKFLMKYSNHLYYHCLEKGYEEELKLGKDPTKQKRDWDFEDLSKDFDFSKFLPYK